LRNRGLLTTHQESRLNDQPTPRMVGNAPVTVVCSAPAMATTARSEAQRALRLERNAAYAAEPLEFTCRACGKPKRRSECEKVKRGQVGKRPLCYKCRAVARRLGGQHYIDMAPDKHPAEHLRDLLADDRRAGMTFDEAWPDCVEFVLSCVPPGPDEDLASWRQVFKETRPAWAAAWMRAAPVKAALTVDLLGGPDRVEIQHRATLVA
jgi:hypothetical protein